MSTAEIRVKEIKLRRLEIAATLAQWKSEYFRDGVSRPMVARAELEAESAALALEAMQIAEQAKLARVERRIKQDAELAEQLVKLCNERGMECLVVEAQKRVEALQTVGAA